MRWTLTLKGSGQDIARLLEVLPDDVTAIEDDPYRAAVILVDPERGATGDPGREAAREAVEATVSRLNGAGKLRWGRSFAGVTSEGLTHVKPDGTREHVIFIGTAKGYLTYEEMVKVAAAQGWPAPTPPDGLADVNALSLPPSSSLQNATLKPPACCVWLTSRSPAPTTSTGCSHMRPSKS